MQLTRRFLSALLLGAAMCAAQAPVVPTDHYGPPSCSADVKPAATRMSAAADTSAARAIAIEEAGAADPTALPSATPFENFDIARDRLIDYGACTGSSGCYWADLDVQYKRAEWALQEQIAKRKAGRKLAVIFDIDETSLSSYCEMQRENYGFVKSLNDEWIVSPQAAVAIPGALRLFNRAKAAGVDVFFITGRPVSQTDGTTRNLEAAGFHGWKHLDLRDPSESGLTRAEYKAGRRKRIVADGYRLILNVGDQWSDLNGEPKAEVSVKLPNPFYFLP